MKLGAERNDERSTHENAKTFSPKSACAIPTTSEIELFVVDQIKGIGRDPSLLRETLAQARREAEETIRRLESERDGLKRQPEREIRPIVAVADWNKQRRMWRHLEERLERESRQGGYDNLSGANLGGQYSITDTCGNEDLSRRRLRPHSSLPQHPIPRFLIHIECFALVSRVMENLTQSHRKVRGGRFVAAFKHTVRQVEGASVNSPGLKSRWPIPWPSADSGHDS